MNLVNDAGFQKQLLSVDEGANAAWVRLTWAEGWPEGLATAENGNTLGAIGKGRSVDDLNEDVDDDLEDEDDDLDEEDDLDEDDVEDEDDDEDEFEDDDDDLEDDDYEDEDEDEDDEVEDDDAVTA